VIAFSVGALPEIVEHGRTGFLVDTPREMSEAIRKVEAIDHNACRTAARERFAAARMVDEYIAVYEQLIENSRRA
jgi:glycosyltransferase involved in cell wall biosynthesis